MTPLTIIPARGGSKRVPNKNLQKVGDKTLVEHAVDQALACQLRPYVVTDSPEISALFDERDPSVRVLREPEHLAGDDVHMSEVIKFVRDTLLDNVSRVLLLQPSSPLRATRDINAAMRVMGRADCDVVVSVTPHRDKDGSAFKTNGAIYLMRGCRWDEGHIEFYCMPKDRGLDIDWPGDLVEARRLAG